MDNVDTESRLNAAGEVARAQDEVIARLRQDLAQMESLATIREMEADRLKAQIHQLRNELSRLGYESLSTFKLISEALEKCKKEGYTSEVALVHAGVDALREDLTT